MAKSVSDAYLVEQNKAIGAKPKYYVGFNTKIDSIDITENPIISAGGSQAGFCLPGGFHNTEIKDDKLRLILGKDSGYWISVPYDSGHLTPNIIYERFTWNQTCSGTITIQIKTATTEANLPTATWATYTNDNADHTERNRWYQIKILFEHNNMSKISAGGSQCAFCLLGLSEISAGGSQGGICIDGALIINTLVLTHKALIPQNDYMSIGSIGYGVDLDFVKNIAAGSFNVSLDNSAQQWSKYSSNSYIYNIEYYYNPIELWAGFELSDGTIEYLKQFVGLIESLNTDAKKLIAIIKSRDLLYHKLYSKKIGTPLSDGSPRAFMAGKRYRVLLKNDSNFSDKIYWFYCQQNITSIDAVYSKNADSGIWTVIDPADYAAGTEIITFDTAPTTDVSVDITINTTNHPIDIIQDIIADIGGTSADYNANSFAVTKAATSTTVIGVAFENISAGEAIKQLCRTIDAAAYIEGGELYVKVYAEPVLTGIDAFQWGRYDPYYVDIYISVYGGDIYRQIKQIGAMNPLGQTSRNWEGITSVSDRSIYAVAWYGDIYKRTGANGDFVSLGQGNKAWTGIDATSGDNVYACVRNGDIYMQTNATGNFSALGQTSRLWYDVAAAPSGNVYACVDSGVIYRQTNGTGNFNSLGGFIRHYYAICATPTNDIYTAVNGGDIYKLTGESGSFVALGQTSRAWRSLYADRNGNVYAGVNGGEIYKQTGGEGDFVAMGLGTYSCRGITALPSFGTLDENLCISCKMHDSAEKIQNRIVVPYGNYVDDITKLVDKKNNISITKYGQISNTLLKYRYNDMISFHTGTQLATMLQTWVDRQSSQFEKFEIELPLEILRMEIFDIVELSNTFLALTNEAILIYSKSINLNKYGGSITCYRYPT